MTVENSISAFDFMDREKIGDNNYYYWIRVRCVRFSDITI